MRRETERDMGGGGPLALFNIPRYFAPNMEIREVDSLFEVNGSTILEANTFKRRAETRKYLGG
jgi:hypothetical protein